MYFSHKCSSVMHDRWPQKITNKSGKWISMKRKKLAGANKIGNSFARGLMYGSGWPGCSAIRSSNGIKTYWLWMLSLIVNFTGVVWPFLSDGTDDSNKRSQEIATLRTECASIHARYTWVASQAVIFTFPDVAEGMDRGFASPCSRSQNS